MEKPLVGIVLGSKSDLSQAEKAADVLREFDVPFEVTIASAHRTPEDVVAYATRAACRGLKVIIGVAGLSAALPGVLAAHSTLPVIGVPVSAGALKGSDALLSIAQMPPGIPVACVGIDGAKNAALLAIRLLAMQNSELAKALILWNTQNARKVVTSREELKDLPAAPNDAFQIV